MTDNKKSIEEILQISLPKAEPGSKIHSLHPLLMIALRFIQNAPLDKIEDPELRKKWKDFQGVAEEALESAADLSQKMYQPYESSEYLTKLCPDQNFRVIISP